MPELKSPLGDLGVKQTRKNNPKQLYYQDFDSIILHEKNIIPDFFDLKTGMAGEILQKFSTYRMRLAIVGDFSKYTSKSINDFMFESNKARQINFVKSLADALTKLSNL
ncbi:DUF4180 domain-containing protein [Spirosoma jeollabukense]